MRPTGRLRSRSAPHERLPGSSGFRVPTQMRVLRLYHSAVVDEYRQRERFLRERHGHEMHVVCPPAWREGGSLTRPTRAPGEQVHVLPIQGQSKPNLFWYAPRPLRGLLYRLRPDIIDLHEEPYSLAAAGVLYALHREAPNARVCVYTAQNLPHEYPPPFSIIERRVLLRAGAAYPCSTEAGDRLRQRGFQGSVHVLPLGVTIPKLTERAQGPLRVGFISRLEPYKGGMMAVRAFAAAAARVDAVMDVIGAGRQQEAMEHQVRLLGMSQRVRFHGALTQDETLSMMGSLDVVLVPSLTTRTWKEQFGRVPVQAMAYGTAVIASDSGSLREVVDDAGVLVPEGDQAALSAALTRLLVEPRLLDEVRMRGRARAERAFSWEAVSDGVDVMYREVVES